MNLEHPNQVNQRQISKAGNPLLTPIEVNHGLSIWENLYNPKSLYRYLISGLDKPYAPNLIWRNPNDLTQGLTVYDFGSGENQSIKKPKFDRQYTVLIRFPIP